MFRRYEAQERQKFTSNAQYVREKPYKMDSESQTFTNESSGSEHGSVIKSSGTRPGLKFPIIDNVSVKQKLKHNISLKKVEKSVLDPNKVTSEPYLQSQSSTISNTTISRSTSTEEVKRPQADQEKLKQHESLLAEDSEEEGDWCPIYQIAEGSPTNPLLESRGCVGSLQFVHQECLKKWLKAKIKSGADLEAVKTCELCKQNLITDVDNFNVNAYYRNHQQSWWNTAISDLE
ncbi:putative E3 ubiquitin-protein ligase MARCHF10 [Phoenicopterus ruber ruber]